MIVTRFKDSFIDSVDGIVIGSGHESLMTQLTNRYENVRRKKFKFGEMELDSQPSTSCNTSIYKEVASDSQSASCGDNETEIHKAWLQAEHTKSERDEERIKQLMAQLHLKQKALIQENFSVEKILEEWPFLAEQMCLFQHFDIELQRSNSEQELRMDFCTRAYSTYK